MRTLLVPALLLAMTAPALADDVPCVIIDDADDTIPCVVVADDTAFVPEPGLLALIGIGAMAGLIARRRKKQA